MERALIRVAGRVQGVGFRWWTAQEARELSLVGYAENLMDGRVEISAQGERVTVCKLIRRLVEVPSEAGRPGRVTSYTIEWLDPEPNAKGFRSW
ncbi:MAG: acylphosphatase [Micropruina sp.]|nr:acylphosphatase [Micropruina sp.]